MEKLVAIINLLLSILRTDGHVFVGLPAFLTKVKIRLSPRKGFRHLQQREKRPFKSAIVRFPLYTQITEVIET